MGAGYRSRDLDSRVLPPLAGVLSRLGGRMRPRALSMIALVSVIAVLMAAVWAANRTPQDTTGGPGLLRVGVVEGQSVPGYIRSSRIELATMVSQAPPDVAPVQAYALVSLIAYLAPDRLVPVLGDATVAQVYARAPLSGIQTQVVRIPAYRVPEDVVAGMLDAALRRDREQAEFGRLSVTLSEGGESGERLRRAYDTAALAAGAEALAYRSGCSCVFAAVVQATPAVLETIADRSEVRAVDPAPEVRHLDQVEFRPPLPEQRSVVTGPSGSAPPAGPVRSSAMAPAVPPAGREGPLEESSLTSMTVTSASVGGANATSGPSIGTSEEPTAVPSALPAGPSASVPVETAGASPGASGR